MKTFLLFIVLSFIGYSVTAQTVNIIPQPANLQMGQGIFTLDKNTEIATRDEAGKQAANFLNNYLQTYYGFGLSVDKQESRNYIRLVLRQFIKTPETDGYSLHVIADGITIEGDTPAGLFYGIQSLIQLLPLPEKGISALSLVIPQLSIQDAPRFKYRGMHLDVSRHFFPVSFVKKYIDYLALHKLNYFHWHLTEDQGWRIEIKKYPELTSIGSRRNGTIIGRYPGKGSDNQPYGGFYTQEEIKEVVKYAAERHITVVPEIEMPGHSSAAIAAYNWLSCFPKEPTKIPANMISNKSKQEQAAGRVKLVQETWGVFDDVYCAGKDSTFVFLQNVLDEVLELFPSTYIHVGGDESPKTNWKRCPNCQRRIKQEKLKDEHELQSYFIQRMEKYLNSKGRILIGWDEILEGGLAPNAVVMSWRGVSGGIEAAKQEHSVIMTPQKPLYFDHTQSRNEDSVTIGGYNPIEAVYAYDPIPAALNNEQSPYILGAQANLWTEYIKNEQKVEYMIFPRMAALSEVVWTPKEKMDYAEFEQRLQQQFKRYDLWKANYSHAYYSLEIKTSPAPNFTGIQLSMASKLPGAQISYAYGNDTTGKTYDLPILLRTSGNLKASLYSGDALRYTLHQPFRFNKATGKKIVLTHYPSDKYPGEGSFTLVNSIHNQKGLSNANEFVGFEGMDCEAIIDLGENMMISRVNVRALHQPASWIHKPAFIRAYVSDDGNTFRAIGTNNRLPHATGNGNYAINFTPVKTRFVKILAKNAGTIPVGQAGAGHPAWLFVDEIEVH